LFSIIGWIVGLIAAFRFSDLAAEHLKTLIDVSPRILSVISFLLVFTLVVVLINLGARLVEKTVQLTMLGWLNRFGGVFFYVLLYTLIFSVLIYLAEKSRLLSEETISSSKVYDWVMPIATVVQRAFLY
jgi:membrane protein required for colicin V production